MRPATIQIRKRLREEIRNLVARLLHLRGSDMGVLAEPSSHLRSFLYITYVENAKPPSSPNTHCSHQQNGRTRRSGSIRSRFPA